MSTNIFVRPGRPDDVERIHELLSVLANEHDDGHRYSGTPESFLRYGFGSWPMFHSLLATTQDGSSVGTCIYLPDFSTWRARPGVYILDLVVEPAHRSRGVGLALVADAARRGRDEWDADYLILSVARSNEGAIRFYEREGFISDGGNQVMTLADLGRWLDRR